MMSFNCYNVLGWTPLKALSFEHRSQLAFSVLPSEHDVYQVFQVDTVT